MSTPTESNTALAATKLEVLVAEHLPGRPRVAAQPFPGGAAAIIDDGAWVYDSDPRRTIGPALLWAAKLGAATLDVVVDDERSDLVEQAAGLIPTPTVWRVEARSLVAVEPAAPVADAAPEADDPVLRELFAGVGLDVVVEHGVVKAEVEGLEIARIAPGADGPVLRIGVGYFDQEANAVVHEDVPSIEVLTRVAAQVRRHRRAGAPPHPLGRLARSRWIRAELLRDPAPLGLEQLVPVPLVRAALGLNDAQAAAALGRASGRTELVVCTIGFDVDLVAVAAELVTRHRPHRVTLVVPRRDHHRRLAAASRWLAVEARLVGVDPPWD